MLPDVAHRFTTVALIVLLAMLGGCEETHSPVGESTPRHAPDSAEIELPKQSPKRAYIKEMVAELVPRPVMEPLPGKILYDETRTVRVRSPIAGRVLAIKASLGARVEKGGVLVELDSPELGQAQAEYRESVADLELADTSYRRVKDLFQRGILPRKELEQAEDVLIRERTEVERTRLKLANLGVSGDRTDNRFMLRAPIAGLVTEVRINPGMEVRPDREEALFVVSDLSRLWLFMEVYEKDLAAIHLGQRVSVTVPAYPGEVFPAVVDNIGKVVDETTRTVKVRSVLANPALRLLPAMYATVEVQSSPGDRAIVVPLTALFTEGESDWLFTVEDDGRYRQREVEIGFRMKDRAVITRGLRPGERIVIEGALLLRGEKDSVEQSGEGPP